MELPDWSMLPQPAVRAVARDNLAIMMACKGFQVCVDDDTKLVYAVERKGARMALRHFIQKHHSPRKETMLINMLDQLAGRDVPRWIFHEIFVKSCVHRLKQVPEWMKTRFDIPVNVVADAALPQPGSNMTNTVHEMIRDIIRSNDMNMLKNAMESGVKTVDMLHSAARHNSLTIIRQLIDKYGAWDLEFCYKSGTPMVRHAVILIDPTLGKLPDFDRYFMLRTFPLRGKQEVLSVIQKLHDVGLRLDPDECLLMAARNNSPELCDYFVRMGATAIEDCVAVLYPHRAVIDWAIGTGASPTKILTSLVRRNVSNYTYDVACTYVAPMARGVDWNAVLEMTCSSKCFRRLVEYIVMEHGHVVDPMLALRASLQVACTTTLPCMVVEKYIDVLSVDDIAHLFVLHGTGCKLKRLLKKQGLPVAPFVRAAIICNIPKLIGHVLEGGATMTDVWTQIIAVCGDGVTSMQMVEHLERMERFYQQSYGKVPVEVVQRAIDTARERGDWVLHSYALRMRCPASQFTNRW